MCLMWSRSRLLLCPDCEASLCVDEAEFKEAFSLFDKGELASGFFRTRVDVAADPPFLRMSMAMADV